MRISTTLLVPVLLSCLAGPTAFAAGQDAKPDNSAINARDKNGAASTPQKQREIDAVLAAHGAQDFAAHWLRHCGLDWAADLIVPLPPEGVSP